MYKWSTCTNGTCVVLVNFSLYFIVSLSLSLSQNRPPRVKRFSARRLLRWLSGSDAQKPAHPKDQRRPNGSSNPRTHDSTHPTASLPADRVSPIPLAPRRTTSFPSTSDPHQISMDPRRPASVAAESSSTAVSVDKEKHTSLPRGYGLESGHKRRHSGGNIPSAQVEGFAQRRPSSPSPPPSFNARLGSHVRPFTEGIQKLIDQEVPVSRVRSLSHPRSPSPHLSLGKFHIQQLCLFMFLVCVAREISVHIHVAVELYLNQNETYLYSCMYMYHSCKTLDYSDQVLINRNVSLHEIPDITISTGSGSMHATASCVLRANHVY